MTGNETTLQLLNGVPNQVTVFAMPLYFEKSPRPTSASSPRISGRTSA